MSDQKISEKHDDLGSMESEHGENTAEERTEMSMGDLVALLTDCVYMNPARPDEAVCIDRPRVVHALMDRLHIKTSVKSDRKKGILIFNNGRYDSDGDLIIEKLLGYAFLDFTTPMGKSLYSTAEKNQILDRIRELTPTLDNKFDSDLKIINMENGLYNWRSGEFSSHDSEYLSRIQIPVEYDPDAKCPTIETFFETVFKADDVPKIIEFIAYSLYRKYSIQKAFVLLGPGGTGKSTFTDILAAFLGDENTFSISPQDLIKDRFAAADFYRKLLNIVPDVGNEKLTQTAVIKTLTGHKDKVRAQRKYQDPFDFINFAKMMFGMNELPETTDKTSGWYRRIEIIRMDHVLKENEFSKEFLDKLTSPAELSGLFNLAIKTLPDLLERGSFTNETSREETAEDYEALSNPMEYFCDNFLINAPGKQITKEDLFQEYVAFCTVAHLHVPKSGNSLGSYFHKNVDWIKGRPKKDEVMKTGGKTVAIWADTDFDVEEFEAWAKSRV